MRDTRTKTLQKRSKTEKQVFGRQLLLQAALTVAALAIVIEFLLK
ncbi:MAG: hypothetical protein ACLRZ6_07940 [Lachnospiraceae bacterium]